MPAVAQPIRHTDELRILPAQPGRYDGQKSPNHAVVQFAVDNSLVSNLDSALQSCCHRICCSKPA